MVVRHVLSGVGALGVSAVLLTATAGSANAHPSADRAIWSAPTVPIPVAIHDLKPRVCYNVHGLLGEKADYLANRTKSSALNLFSEPNCGGGLFIDAIFPPDNSGSRSESHKNYYSFNVSPLSGGGGV
ncbi:hypothetical protein ACFORH_34830 [Amycolatopsis roodepoortensis]|uniref:Uncharacterized protein n=1 Tax=Amycolatopsis roodepoortensis TaxID=700274 RepID=A0ABR9L2I0_9PSEU|nr:hypothetical protein [Amycolatopsis roodepoortensis]MBE1574303.1 hypothetical protein [Amycolatopsis roodepoortensis]